MKKKLIIAATAGAVAVTAGQALALENQFNGAFSIRATNSNYVQATSGNLSIADSKTTTNFIDQRTRLAYTAKANDNLKLVTGFEIDSTWGKSAYTQGRSADGGAIGADTINLETRNGYIDFSCPITGANVKAGIMTISDAYKGILFGGADAAGLSLTKGFGPVTANVGWFRLNDAAQTGKETRDLLIVDGKFAVNKDVKVGASYYFLNSDNAKTQAAQTTVIDAAAVASGTAFDQAVHIFGANAAATFGPATLDGYFIYETGYSKPGPAANNHVKSFAGNVGATVKVGTGALKANALVTGGGVNQFANITNFGSATYGENQTGPSLGQMFLLVRSPQLGGTNNDQYLAFTSDNSGYGIVGGSVGYTQPITDKLAAAANLGMLYTQKAVANRDSKFQGAELNAQVSYKLFPELTAAVEGAYVRLGGFYKHKGFNGTDPANPYVARIVLAYAF